MKYIFFFLLSGCLFAQEAEVVNWINTNAIVIPDTRQDSQLEIPDKYKPIFNKVRLFGFGEATHNTKEFFDIKAKFFKYLVQHHDVTTFMIEDSFYGGFLVDQYITGGKGDAKTLAENMGFAIWRTAEIQDLMQWMHDYNIGKPAEKQIRFYGIDDQFGLGADVIITDFSKKHNLGLDYNDALMLREVATARSSSKIKDLPGKLYVIENKLKGNLAGKENIPKGELDFSLYAFEILKQYLELQIKNGNQIRDGHMAQNINWVMQYGGAGTKGFVWAHNGHVSKLDDATNMGYRLKMLYGEQYYSVGFDFATGKLYGKRTNEKKATIYTINKPFEKFYAEVLYKAKPDVFMMDFKEAAQNPAMKKFLSTNYKSFALGAWGYHPKLTGENQKYDELYDALIFVKSVSLPDYIGHAAEVLGL